VLEIPIDFESPDCHKFDKFWKSDVKYVAEIRCKEDKGLSSFNNGQVPKEYVLSQMRSKSQKSNPFISGRCMSIKTSSRDGIVCKTISIEFNCER
jgi:hypothetical protein